MDIKNIKLEYKILIGSIIISFLIFIISINLFNIIITISNSRFFYLMIIVISIAIFPFLFYKYFKNQEFKKMEDNFPIFLKDLADNLNAGLTLIQSIRTATKTDYKSLTPEIIKLNNKLSWGVNFEVAINEMIDDLKESPIITRGLTVLLQAFRSGGKINEVISKVADSTIILKNVEKDQESEMSQQAIIMYIIQIVFIAIIIVLFKVLIPITTGVGFGSELFGGTTSGTKLTLNYYKTFFLITLIIQSICSGFVAGIASSGKLIEGVKHISIMLLISILLFTIFVLPKTILISVELDKNIIGMDTEFTVKGTVYQDDINVKNNKIILYYNNQTFNSSTNEKGDFSFLITSPHKRGEYGGKLVTYYDKKKSETTFTFSVK